MNSLSFCRFIPRAPATAHSARHLAAFGKTMPPGGARGLVLCSRPATGEQFEPGDHTGSVGSRRSEEHTSELQSLAYLVCRLLLEKKKKKYITSLRDSN